MLGAGTLQLGQSYALDWYYFNQSTTQETEMRLQLGWWGGWPVLLNEASPDLNIPKDRWVHLRLEFTISAAGEFSYILKVDGEDSISGIAGTEPNAPSQISFYFNSGGGRVYLSDVAIARVS